MQTRRIAAKALQGIAVAIIAVAALCAADENEERTDAAFFRQKVLACSGLAAGVALHGWAYRAERRAEL